MLINDCHVYYVDEAVKSLHQSKPRAEGWKFRAIVPSITTSVHPQCAMKLCFTMTAGCHKVFMLHMLFTFWILLVAFLCIYFSCNCLRYSLH